MADTMTEPVSSAPDTAPDALRAALVGLLRYVEDFRVPSGLWIDNACKQCTTAAISETFVCAYHRALATASAPATGEPSADVLGYVRWRPGCCQRCGYMPTDCTCPSGPVHPQPVGEPSAAPRRPDGYVPLFRDGTPVTVNCHVTYVRGTADQIIAYTDEAAAVERAKLEAGHDRTAPIWIGTPSPSTRPAEPLFNPRVNLPGEYDIGRMIREAVDYDPDNERMYLICSVGELAQRICATRP